VGGRSGGLERSPLRGPWHGVPKIFLLVLYKSRECPGGEWRVWGGVSTPNHPVASLLCVFNRYLINSDLLMLPSASEYLNQPRPTSAQRQVLRDRGCENVALRRLTSAQSGTSGVAIWCARRAVHAGPSLWGRCGGRRALCGEEEGSFLILANYSRSNLATPLSGKEC